jgi:hypothetical protein
VSEILGRRVWRVAVTALVVLLLAAGLASASVSGRWSWSSPRLVDHHAPPGTRYALSGVSCASRSLCVAVGGYGSVQWSTDPADGAASWRAAVVDEGAGPLATATNIDDVSCASVSLCVAVDASGNALVSRRPSGGARAWKLSEIDPRGGGALLAVSCVSRALCVAADSAGRVLSTRDPADVGRPWKRVVVPAQMTSLACPSVALCVGADSSGDVAVSTDPTGGARRWKVIRLVSGSGLTVSYRAAVSCPSVSLCVAAIGSEVLFSSDPAGGASAWQMTYRIPGITPNGFGGLACATSTSCVAFTTAGGYVDSAEPAGGQGAWMSGSLSSAFMSTIRVVCPARALCVGVGQTLILTSAAPVGGGAAWMIGTPPGGYNSIEGLRCPSARLCIGFDNAGNVLTSTRPADGERGWSLAHVDPSPIVDLVCPSAALCVALDQAGYVLTATRPAGGVSAWTRSQIPGDNSRPFGLACPSASLCVAVGGGIGDVIVSSDPTGGGQRWVIQTIDTSSFPCGGNHPVTPTYCAADLTAIACPNRSLCVAVDSNGNAVISTDPAGGARTWTTRLVDPDSNPAQNDNPLQFIACPSASFCAAADFQGNIVSSRDPANAPVWNVAAVTSSYGFLGDFACPASTLCIGIDNNHAVTSTTPAGPARAWKRFPIGTTAFPAGYTAGYVTCLSRSFCAADDESPMVATSTDPARGTTAWRASQADPNSVTALACASTSLCLAADAQGNITTGKRLN